MKFGRVLTSLRLCTVCVNSSDVRFSRHFPAILQCLHLNGRYQAHNFDSATPQKSSSTKRSGRSIDAECILNLPREFDADVDGGARVVRVRECGGERGVHGRHQEAFPGMKYDALEMFMITMIGIQLSWLRFSLIVLNHRHIRISYSRAQEHISCHQQECHKGT